MYESSRGGRARDARTGGKRLCRGVTRSLDGKPLNDVKQTCTNIVRMVKCKNSAFVKGKPTPTLVCDFVHQCGKFTAVCVPDTGATKTCVDARIIAKAGLCKHIEPSDEKIILLGVDGCEFNVLGYMDLSCSVLDGKTVYMQVLVVENMLDSVLFSWSDMVLMGIVSEKFPLPEHCRRSGNACFATIEGARDALLLEFEDVFSDKLHGRHIAGEPMKIELRSDIPVDPIHISTARKVPLHYEEMADEVVNELRVESIIEPAPGLSNWCSPAHFVLKLGGKKVRLVTDFTRLNKFVKRPVHPFPSASDILMSVKAGSKYFACLDLVWGYFQCEMAPE